MDVSLEVEPRHLNLSGTLHGGMIATLADTATGLAYRTGLDEGASALTSSTVFANRAAGELFGIDAATLVGKQITDLLRPAYRAMMRKHLSAALETPELPQPLEVQLISSDDRGRWKFVISASMTPKR